jgi:serine/threonine protein phosphatase PrpC
MQANDLVVGEARWSPSWTGMGTTLAAVVFAGGQAICVNVGDSRCYRISEGSLVPLSTDDSPPLPSGWGPDTVSTVVTQTLGGASTLASIDPHLWSGATFHGDQFLLCSDGLTDYVPLDVIEGRLQDAEADPVGAVAAVLEAALAAGGKDNVSIVLVTVTG